MKSRIASYIPVCLITLHVLLLGYSATVHSPVADEVGHFAAGLSHWEFGHFELFCVNPPLVRSVATIPLFLARVSVDWGDYDTRPYKRSEFVIGAKCADEHKSTLMMWYYSQARWMCIPFSMIGALVCYYWSRDLWGHAAGCFSMSLWCFCPNILGNAALITPDTTAGALGVATCYLFWKWGRRPTLAGAIIAGLTLGCVVLTKFTWLILYGILPVLWLMQRPSRTTKESSFCQEALQLLAAFTISLWLVNTGYLFSGSCTAIGDFNFSSSALTGRPAAESMSNVGNRFRDTWSSRCPIPLPKDFVLGVDFQKDEFERGHLSYLRGEARHGGWWYYYLYAMLIKLPLGTLLLLVLAFGFAWRTSKNTCSIRDQLYLLLPAITLIGIVSSQTGFNHHLRYVLPAFPFLFIFAGQATAWLKSRFIALMMAPIICLGWAVTSSLAVYPHSLSYFNELIGGPRNGWRHLSHSNVDWGQDFLYVKKWQDAHLDAKPVYLKQVSFIEANNFGIKYDQVSTVTRSTEDSKVELVLPPGWYILSLNRMTEPDSLVGPLLDVEPTDYIGFSMRVYHLTEPFTISSISVLNANER